mmetsp:Transcript_27204/g.46239  ORF Transcript_27204/g.46239 Transcript_27204/m.46239 type:complete len:84 (-) Transcript_27204:8-259(-)
MSAAKLVIIYSRGLQMQTSPATQKKLSVIEVTKSAAFMDVPLFNSYIDMAMPMVAHSRSDLEGSKYLVVVVNKTDKCTFSSPI